MPRYYAIYATNLYAVAATLVHLRFSLNFRPHKAFGNKDLKSPFGKSTIDLELDDNNLTIADILYEMNEKYKDTFKFEILSEA